MTGGERLTYIHTSMQASAGTALLQYTACHEGPPKRADQEESLWNENTQGAVWLDAHYRIYDSVHFQWRRKFFFKMESRVYF